MAIVLRVTAPAIVAGLLLSGCGGNGGTTTAPLRQATATTGTPTSLAAASPSVAVVQPRATQPRGWKLVVDKPNGYQLALPPTYERFTIPSRYLRTTGNPSGRGMYTLGYVYKTANAAAASSGLTRHMANKSVAMIAMNLATASEITVVVASAGGLTGDQLPTFEPALTQEASGIGAQNLVFTHMTLESNPALRASYTRKVPGCPRSTTITYITVRGNHTYILTFDEPTHPNSKIEKQVTASWHFL